MESEISAMNLPLPELTIATGSPYRVGVELGRQEAERIHAAYDTLGDLVAFTARKPWWMPFPLYRSVAMWQARNGFESKVRRHYPSYHSCMAGMADGADVDLATMYLFLAIESVGPRSEVKEVDPPFAGCTAVGLAGDRTTNGEPLVAHNLDQVEFARSYLSLRDNRGADELRYVGLTFSPLCGVVDGINEAGLCITYNYAVAIDGETSGPSVSIAIGDALAHCETAADAIDRIRSRPRSGGAMLLLADATGDLARLELSPTRSSVERTSDRHPAEGVLSHSNAYHVPAMQEVQVSPRAVYSDVSPAPLRGKRVLESAERRDARLAELFADGNRIDEATLETVLADHGPDGEPDDGTVCMHGDHWSTIACVRMFPRERRIRVTYGAACEATYTDFRL
jgi:hypothetical protein